MFLTPSVTVQHCPTKIMARVLANRAKHEFLSLFRSPARSFPLKRDDLCAFTGTSSQGFFQSCRASVFSQQVGERLVGQFLKRFHVFGRQQPQLLPGFLVKLHTFADHGV
jgi:hypothetical protein